MATRFLDSEGNMRFFLNGEEVTEQEYYAVNPTGVKMGAFKPIHSETLSVHPRQRKKFMEDAVKRGIPTYFDKKGRPVFTSRKHMKDYCQSVGAFNRDACYGDAAPGSYKGDRPDEVDPATLYGIPQEANHGQVERGDLYEAIRAVKRRHGL